MEVEINPMKLKTNDKKPFGLHEFIVLVCLLVPFFVLSFATSAQGPFFPTEATRKGLTPAVYGLVPAIYRLMLVILCPFMGIFVARIGTRSMFLIGVTLNGLGPLGFGLLYYVNSTAAFTALALILRTIEGIGSCFIQIPGFMIVNENFPGRTSTVSSLLLTAIMLGFCFGPTVAAILYDVGGFTLPFLVIGLIQIVSAALINFILVLPDSNEETQALMGLEALTKFNSFFKFPFIYIFMFGVMSVNMGNGFCEAILEPGLQVFHLSSLQIGLTFGLLGVFQLLIPLWGIILDRIKRGEVMALVGCFIAFLGVSMFGPLPFIPVHRAYPITAIGIAIFGLGKGITAASSYVMLKREVEANVGDTLLGSSFVATCQVGATGIGGVIGAAVGGILYGAYSFRMATLLLVSTFLILFILLLIFICQQSKLTPKSLRFSRFRNNHSIIKTLAEIKERTPLMFSNPLSQSSLKYSIRPDGR